MILIIDKFRLFLAKLSFRLYRSFPKYLFEIDYLKKFGINLKAHGNGYKFYFTINNQSIPFNIRRNSSDSAVFRQVILEDEYIPIIDLINKNGDYNNIKNVFDLGANVGFTSLYFGAFYPEACIISIEPENTNFKLLSTNVKSNSNIAPLNAGVWFRDSTLKLKRDFRDKRDWSFYLEESENGDINAFSISSLMNRKRLNKLDILKMDIEGGERYLFADKENYTFLQKVKYLCIEIHDEFNVREKIMNALDEYGFEYFEKGETLFAVNKEFNY